MPTNPNATEAREWQGWVDVRERSPEDWQIVLVHGGIAQYRSGIFYTGMECPQYQRPIMWPVTHWALFPVPPKEERNAKR